MNATIRALNIIKIAAMTNKVACEVRTNGEVRSFLDVLVDLNLIEYTSTPGGLGTIKIKYKDGAPIIKDIVYIGGEQAGKLTSSGLKKILCNRRALYIVKTAGEVMSINAAVAKNHGGLVLFKITI